jgi:membrane protease YdiL (CAAX protease family)
LGATLDYALGGKDLISFSGNLLFAALLSYPSIFFLGGPLNEEPGWRGFATPRIQKRLTPLLTGLLIGVIWTVWHLPLHLTSFYGDGLNGFLFRFLFNVPLGILFTWYYNRSGSNLFGCILFHASVNVSSGIFGSNSALLAVLIVIVFAVLVIISDKMYRMPIKDKMEEKKILSLNAV